MTTFADLRLEPLDLAQTLGCGQTFRWRPLADGSWRGPLNNQLITLTKNGPSLRIEAFPGGQDTGRLVEEHLRAEDDVISIQRELAHRDPKMASGMRKLKGLRIVKIDEWECLASFMLATYANIPRISRMIDTIARNYGSRITSETYSFPNLNQLRRASLQGLQRCGLGYRAKYIRSVCQHLADGDIERWKALPYHELRGRLKELPGVGDKVADCVALFGFGRLESFPIDVWMERALKRLYGQHGSYRSLAAFAHEKFGDYAGYAQEYLYYNERLHASGGSCVFSKDRGNR